jgi:prevent-host-death family protein
MPIVMWGKGADFTVVYYRDILPGLLLTYFGNWAIVYTKRHTRLTMKFANVKELQRDASGIIGLVEKGEDVIIMKRGKPAAVIYPLTEDEVEDYMIQHSPTIRKKIEEGLKDVKERKTIPLRDLLKARKRV